MRKKIIVVFVVFCLAILGVPAGLFAGNGIAARNILIESITGQLNAVTAAAAEIIYEDDLQAFKTRADFLAAGVTESEVFDGEEFSGEWEDLNENYRAVVQKLRHLIETTNGESGNALKIKYIYTVVKIGSDYRFVFDTDAENITPFMTYTGIGQTHLDAFAGHTSACMEVEDEYGSFHTGARPLMDGETVIGIVSADIEDGAYRESIKQFNIGMTLCCVVPFLILTVFALGLMMLLNNIRHMQHNLRRMAHYDKLTDIPNRRYLLEQLECMTAGKKPHPFALFFIDLDNFKLVNDNAGHDAGDELLRHIAAYLQGVHIHSKVFRPGPGSVSLTARVGGDEFIIIAPGIDNERDAAAYAAEILEGFTSTVKDKYALKYRVGLSIGAALFPAHTKDYTHLISCADTAMYYAKRNGKNSYRIFSEDMFG